MAQNSLVDVRNIANVDYQIFGNGGWLTLGYNDMTVSPTSMYAAYNTIPSPKTLFLIEDIGHTVYPEQRTKEYEWLDSQLKVEN